MLIHESCIILNETKKKIVTFPLSNKEMEIVHKKFGKDLGCSFLKDKDGKYFCHTQRARSKSHDSLEHFPKKEYDFICGTG